MKKLQKKKVIKAYGIVGKYDNSLDGYVISYYGRKDYYGLAIFEKKGDARKFLFNETDLRKEKIVPVTIIY